MAIKKSKGKLKVAQSVLLTPNPNTNSLINRDEWIENAAKGFISTSQSNKKIYRVILETLWPQNHGIPGPIIDSVAIRQSVNKAKGKPYLDVFRRLRELQGDEGFLGIVKQGNRYQLIDINIHPKKLQGHTFLTRIGRKFFFNTATNVPHVENYLMKTVFNRTIRFRELVVVQIY